MSKKLYTILAVVLLASMALTACAPAATPAPVQPTEAPAQPTAVVAPTTAPVAAATEAAPQPTVAATQAPAKSNLKVGLVTDTGGVNDKSFNQSAWEGVQKAATDLGVQVKFIESKQPTDYDKNIDEFATEGYNVIITVGFLMGDSTAAKAKQYPNIKFAIIDNSYFPTKGSAACPDTVKDCYADGGLTNVTSLMFQEDQVGFLAGVLAAGMSKTGTVCSVAGVQIPPVERYITGYQSGAKWFNPNAKTLNVYVPSFTDPTKGHETGLSEIGQGCDVVFGAGGNTGNGGLLAASEKGLLAIGVDVDQYNTYPEVKASLISSAMKNVDVAVYEYLKTVVAGTDKAGAVTANLQNAGVGLAPFHDWESKIPDAVKAKIQEATDGLKAGTITTGYKAQ
jgi:basic membrane protein A